MPKATYKYGAFALPADDAHPLGSTAFRPQVLATVTAQNGEKIPCLALLDSGADICLFPLKLALQLKLDILGLPKALIGGVGSQANVTYYDTLTIDLGDGIVFSALVGFTQGLDSIALGLLGQSGFFERFNVEFLHSRKIFTIESA